MLRTSSPRRAGRALTALLAASSVGLVPAMVRAQTRTFTVDRLVIAGAPDDGIGVWRPDVGRDTRFFGQLGLGLAINPLRVDNYVDDLNKAEKIAGPAVSSQFITYLNAGVELFNRASVQ
ncbi:MAG: cell envelope biogenesis protein OmpA, partial [Byssovorax sp.]